LSLAALVLAVPSPDECLLPGGRPASTSGIRESPLLPLGVRCRYTGPAGETLAVVDHQPPLPLVVAAPLLAAGTVVVAVPRRRRRRRVRQA
jgi:hypothetical protein